jgi:hypothetical protein
VARSCAHDDAGVQAGLAGPLPGGVRVGVEGRVERNEVPVDAHLGRRGAVEQRRRKQRRKRRRRKQRRKRMQRRRRRRRRGRRRRRRRRKRKRRKRRRRKRRRRRRSRRRRMRRHAPCAAQHTLQFASTSEEL